MGPEGGGGVANRLGWGRPVALLGFFLPIVVEKSVPNGVSL